MPASDLYAVAFRVAMLRAPGLLPTPNVSVAADAEGSPPCGKEKATVCWIPPLTTVAVTESGDVEEHLVWCRVTKYEPVGHEPAASLHEVLPDVPAQPNQHSARHLQRATR